MGWVTCCRDCAYRPMGYGADVKQVGTLLQGGESLCKFKSIDGCRLKEQCLEEGRVFEIRACGSCVIVYVVPNGSVVFDHGFLKSCLGQSGMGETVWSVRARGLPRALRVYGLEMAGLTETLTVRFCGGIYPLTA